MAYFESYQPGEERDRIRKPEYAKKYQNLRKDAHEYYCNVWKPVAKDTNKTRRNCPKPTVGQIKRVL